MGFFAIVGIYQKEFFAVSQQQKLYGHLAAIGRLLDYEYLWLECR
jgi:hypothetical protein